MKRTSRLLAASLSLALVAAACGDKEKSTPSSTGGGGTSTSAPGEPTEATEIGISETEIRIAVLADVENPILDGLFKGAKDAVEAFGKYVNDNGGLAGRKLVVDFIDTGLNAEKVKSALQKACKEDFAMVGTEIVLVESFDPMIKCEDQAGAALGIPDFAGISVDPTQQSSPVTFSALPPERDFSDTENQTFITRTGAYKYFKEELGVSHGVYLNSADSQTAKNGNAVRFYAAQKVVGITDDGGDQSVSGFATEADYLPFAQTLKTKGSNFAESGGGYQGTIKFRRAANQVGVTGVTWSCVLTCYDKGMLEGGSDVEGTYVNMPFLPFYDKAEQDAVPGVKAFVDAVGEENANGFALQAWASALLFKKTVEDLVAKSGVNSLTRKALLEQVATIHEFDADGLLGVTDVAARKANTCMVLVQVKDGKFERVLPKEVGKLDCQDANVTKFTADVWPEG